MSTLMTERRRPLEHDDGQGALFGGEAFAPARPAPAWQRPADRDASSPPSGRRAGMDAAPAGVTGASKTEADAAAPAESRPAPSGRAGDPTLSDATAPGAFDAPEDADAAAQRVSASGAGASEARALDTGTAAPTRRPSPFADEIAELERATDVRSPRRPRAPLAGPTLDDVMSRVWEGLAAGLPAACPVCHGEVAPAISGPPLGRCSSCGTTID